MFEYFKKKFTKQEESTTTPEKKPRTKKAKSAKELATENGEPYINIISIDVDPENLHQGSFELDWNDKFIANLVRAGYQMKPDDTDSIIVDRWFQNICRHVVLETWEQEQAMHPQRMVKRRDLGDGRSEMS